MKSNSFVWLAGILILLATVNALQAQGTAFTYQGRLNDGGSPATGNYDLTFALYNSPSMWPGRSPIPPWR